MLLEKASAYHLSVLLPADGVAPDTIRNYAGVERAYCAWVPTVTGQPATLADLTPARVRAYTAYLRLRLAVHRLGGAPRPLAASTIHNHVRQLKAWAHRLSTEDDAELRPLLADDPLAKLRTPRVPKKTVPAFTEQQVEALLTACLRTRKGLQQRNYALLYFLLDTGCRVSEVCRLRIDQVQFATTERPGRAHVLGKGQKERWVLFTTETSRELKRWLTLERADDCEPWLFCEEDGRQMTRNALALLIRDLGRWVGITGQRCSPHVFRHTFALWFLRSNPGQLLQLQQLLGHSTLRQTSEYARLVSADAEAVYVGAVKRLGRRR